MTLPATDTRNKVLFWLEKQALPLWATRGLDAKGGGFVEQLTLEGEIDPLAEFKRIRVQARQAYVYLHADLLGLFPGGREVAKSGLDFLFDCCRRSDGGWMRRVTVDGKKMDETPDTYDHAFVLYALAWSYKVIRDDRSKSAALETLSFMDAQLSVEGDRGFLQGNPQKLPRGQNPHMHFLEAMLAWYDATGDKDFLVRAKSVVELFCDVFYDKEQKTLGEFFDENWKSDQGISGQITEPGHHFEWCWLLSQYEKAADVSLGSAASDLFDFAKRYGLDAKNHLPYMQVLQNGKVYDDSFRCWSLTEYIKACVAFYEKDGRREQELMQAVELLLDTFLNHSVSGGWKDHLYNNGQIKSKAMPASTFYHVFLALAEFLRVTDGP